MHASSQTHSRTSLRVFLPLLSLLGVLVLVIMACGGSSDNSGTSVGSNGSSAQSTTQPKQAHFKVGDHVKVGDTYIVTINSFKQSPGDEFDKPKAGNMFVVIDLTIKNISTDEQDVSTDFQCTLKDSTGQKYDQTILSNATDPSGKLAAGDVVKGQIAYEVSASQHNFTFLFEADIISSGQSAWDLHV